MCIFELLMKYQRQFSTLKTSKNYKWNLTKTHHPWTPLLLLQIPFKLCGGKLEPGGVTTGDYLDFSYYILAEGDYVCTLRHGGLLPTTEWIDNGFKLSINLLFTWAYLFPGTREKSKLKHMYILLLMSAELNTVTRQYSGPILSIQAWCGTF